MRSRGTAASALQDRNGGDTGDMGGSLNGDTPEWMVCKEKLIKMDDLGVPLVQETLMWTLE